MNSNVTMSTRNNDEYGYGLAYKIACEQLVIINDIENHCLKSDAQYHLEKSGGIITVDFLNRTYNMSLPKINISLVDSKEEVPIREKILILHYIIQAKGTPLSNKAITYKDLPEGVSYFRTFSKRAIEPIVKHFGSEPEKLPEIAKLLNGFSAEYGDTAITINAFSRIPITYVLWHGDEEFPPSGNIMFDKNITDYLTVEDINVICEITTWRLVKLKHQ